MSVPCLESLEEKDKKTGSETWTGKLNIRPVSLSGFLVWLHVERPRLGSCQFFLSLMDLFLYRWYSY